MSKIY